MGKIQQRGNDFSIWIIGMQRVDGVCEMFDDVLKGISGSCGMSWPGTNGVINSIFVCRIFRIFGL